jgi:hypothetical protein
VRLEMERRVEVWLQHGRIERTLHADTVPLKPWKRIPLVQCVRCLEMKPVKAFRLRPHRLDRFTECMACRDRVARKR